MPPHLGVEAVHVRALLALVLVLPRGGRRRLLLLGRVRAHAAAVVQGRGRGALLGQLREHGLHDVVVVQAAEAGQLQQRLGVTHIDRTVSHQLVL